MSGAQVPSRTRGPTRDAAAGSPLSTTSDLPGLSGHTRARAEWDPLIEVMIHRPGIEMFFGLMEPYSFLYERAFRIDEATHEHAELEHALAEEGVRVRHLIHLAVELGHRHPDFLELIRSRVLDLVRYAGPREMVTRARAALVANLDRFDGETLFNILLLRPSIRLERHPGERVILPKVILDTPLANLYFMRDQQALTASGFILGRMSKPQRQNEPMLTGALLRTWGADIVTDIRSPGTFEGGDFLPLGEFALLGTGDRTNASAVRQILSAPIGFDEVGVVHQPSHPAIPGDVPDPMIDMHLDTYLNVPGEGLAIGCDILLRSARVEIFHRSPSGRMIRDPKSRTLPEYLSAKRFDLIPLSTIEQMAYATNFLCVRDRKILAVEVEDELERALSGLAEAAHHEPHRYGALFKLAQKERNDLREGRGFFPHTAALRDRGIEVAPLHLSEITGGYGGAHCMTCVMARRAS
jgi:arginine deiminase